MKTVFVLCFVAMVTAEDFSIKLEENGQKFTEKIKLDTVANTEEYDVPAHQDRVEMHLLKDFNKRLVAMKVPVSKVCYVEALESDVQAPKDLKKSMELSNSRFPSERYMVHQKQHLVIRKMTEEEVGEKIAAHCAGYEIVFTVTPKDNNIEKLALELAKPLQRQRKRDTFTSFWACDIKSSYVPRACKLSGGRLAARCHFWRDDRRTCVYEITCRTVYVNGQMAATCDGDHKYSLMSCCDYICL
ncbi:uncharacterized protein LOC135695515 [Rhopilema esculentum]|uniref:uncharacterized protein LOC135695515 n=1 Tax=Rhopilema esculentum TaxID=499914 RepID=UPI0031CDE344